VFKAAIISAEFLMDTPGRLAQDRQVPALSLVWDVLGIPLAAFGILSPDPAGEASAIFPV